MELIHYMEREVDSLESMRGIFPHMLLGSVLAKVALREYGPLCRCNRSMRVLCKGYGDNERPEKSALADMEFSESETKEDAKKRLKAIMALCMLLLEHARLHSGNDKYFEALGAKVYREMRPNETEDESETNDIGSPARVGVYRERNCLVRLCHLA